MCDQQNLRSACAYAQSDQSLCKSLKYSMTVKLLTEQHLEFLSLKGSWRGSSASTVVKMTHCWKPHAAAHIKKMNAHSTSDEFSDRSQVMGQILFTSVKRLTSDCCIVHLLHKQLPYTRGEFNNASARRALVDWYLSLFITCKAGHQYNERPRALALLNLPRM